MSRLARPQKVDDGPTRHTTPSRFWVKLDALLHRNPKIAHLTDAQFRAYITVLGEAKLCQSEGEWPTEEHLRFALGPKLSRQIPALIDARLLELDLDGWVRVHDWVDWQPRDPTAAERSARYRARQRAERDARNATRDATAHDVDETREIQERDGAMVALNGHGAIATVGRCPGCDRPILSNEEYVAVTIDGNTRDAHRACLSEAGVA